MVLFLELLVFAAAIAAVFAVHREGRRDVAAHRELLEADHRAAMAKVEKATAWMTSLGEQVDVRQRGVDELARRLDAGRRAIDARHADLVASSETRILKLDRRYRHVKNEALRTINAADASRVKLHEVEAAVHHLAAQLADGRAAWVEADGSRRPAWRAAGGLLEFDPRDAGPARHELDAA